MTWIYDLFEGRPEINEGTYLRESIQLKYLASEENANGMIVDVHIVKPTQMPIEELTDFIYDNIVHYGKNALLLSQVEIVNKEGIQGYLLKG